MIELAKYKLVKLVNEMDFEVIYNKKCADFDKTKLHKKLAAIFGEENVSQKEIDILSYSNDFILLSARWTLEGKIAAKPDFIVWPTSSKQISDLFKLANKVKVPIVPFGAGSGVVGGALPIFGGVIVDMKKMDKIIEINDLNLTATIQAGKNGMNIERDLNNKGYTLGHIPQSIFTSTLGGYLAHKAAGQFSTKYGKIEDMIIGFEAILPTGEDIQSKVAPRTSVGPQVDKLLIGSEGTLAIITEATVRIWPQPEQRTLVSFSFEKIEDALNSVREILRKQVYPAVVRIYDQDETERHFGTEKNYKDRCMTIFVCEGDIDVVALEEKVTKEICLKNNGFDCGESPVEHWFETRFNVSEISKYTPIGVIVDTIEVAIMWDGAGELYHNTIKAMKQVRGVITATGHVSHAYPQGVGFYFSFSGVPEKQTPEKFSKAVWDSTMESTVMSGGSIAHHHGIGIVRSGWMETEWGSIMPLLKKIKKTLDPKNILNPGKLYDGPIE